MKPKALVAMSGGVDSGVAAYLTQKEYEAIGVTMKLFEPQNQEDAACGSSKEAQDARKVAQKLNMDFQIVDCSGKFQCAVIDRFIDAYERGITPNPCVDCNRYLKFGELFHLAKQMGAQKVVTGHYARVEPAENGHMLLKKALDPQKDQSYVLYSLTKEQLQYACFPLGTLTKDKVRQIAAEQGFAVAHKKDSQDICFVPDKDYAAFMERHTGKTYPPGNFVGVDGQIFGQHKGIIRYTVGQRKGLGLSFPQPMYVKELDTANNQVVLATDEQLFSHTLYANDVNLIAIDQITTPLRCMAKVRYRHTPAMATVTMENGLLKVVFDEPQRAITKGQAVVLYDGDVVIGGGTIV